jgi:hypothetical protein
VIGFLILVAVAFLVMVIALRPKRDPLDVSVEELARMTPDEFRDHLKGKCPCPVCGGKR